MRLDYRQADAADPALAALIEAHADHSAAHYPDDSNHHLDGVGMAADGVIVFAGFADGEAVAMGGYKVIAPDAAEVKSMYVTASARGQGAAQAILRLILDHARVQGIAAMFLETGSCDASAAARRLYERAGFDCCPPFGGYTADPMSVFMTRQL